MTRSLGIAALVVFAGACTGRALLPAGGDTSARGHDGGSNADGSTSGMNGDGGIADMNGDGFTRGDGGGGAPVDMAQPTPLPTERGAKVATGVWLLASDLNDDGKSDLVVLQQNGTIRIYLGQAAGTLFTGQSFELNTDTSATMFVLADVDGDGLPDLVTAEPGRNEVDIHRANTGGDTFGDWARLTIDGTVQSVAVGDLDGDGAPEVVALSLDGFVRVFRGTKGGMPRPTTQTFMATMGAQQITLVDANLDGNLDAVTVDQGSTVSVLLGDGALHFAAPSTMLGPPSGSRLLVGDWDSDGIPDVAALGVSTGEVYATVANDFQGAHGVQTILAASSTGGLAGGDMTGDGKDDLVLTGDASSTLEILVSGLGSVPSAVKLDEPASFIVLGDFDGNGQLDVAAAGPTKTQLYLSPTQ